MHPSKCIPSSRRESVGCGGRPHRATPSTPRTRPRQTKGSRGIQSFFGSKSEISSIFEWGAGRNITSQTSLCVRALHLPASDLSGYLKPKHSQIHSCEIELCLPKANSPFIMCGVCVWKICVYFSLFFIQIYHQKQKNVRRPRYSFQALKIDIVAVPSSLRGQRPLAKTLKLALWAFHWFLCMIPHCLC